MKFFISVIFDFVVAFLFFLWLILSFLVGLLLLLGPSDFWLQVLSDGIYSLECNIPCCLGWPCASKSVLDLMIIIRKQIGGGGAMHSHSYNFPHPLLSRYDKLWIIHHTSWCKYQVYGKGKKQLPAKFLLNKDETMLHTSGDFSQNRAQSPSGTPSQAKWIMCHSQKEIVIMMVHLFLKPA